MSLLSRFSSHRRGTSKPAATPAVKSYPQPPQSSSSPFARFRKPSISTDATNATDHRPPSASPQVSAPVSPPPVPLKPRKIFLSPPPPPRIIRTTSTEEEEVNESWTFMPTRDNTEDTPRLDYSSASSSSRDRLPKSRLKSLPLLPKQKHGISPAEDIFQYDDDSASAQSQDDRYKHGNRQYSGDSISSLRGNAPAAKPAREFRVEPDDQWKKELRANIEDNLRPMVEKATQNFEADLKKVPVGMEERRRIAAEYSKARANIRRIATEAFQAEVDRERRERRRAVGQATPPKWDLALKQEHQDFTYKTDVRENRSAPPSAERMAPAKNTLLLSPTEIPLQLGGANQTRGDDPPVRARRVGTRNTSENDLLSNRLRPSPPGSISRSLPRPVAGIWDPSFSTGDNMAVSAPYEFGTNSSILSFESMNSVSSNSERSEHMDQLWAPVMRMATLPPEESQIQEPEDGKGRKHDYYDFTPLWPQAHGGHSLQGHELSGDEGHSNELAIPLGLGDEGGGALGAKGLVLEHQPEDAIHELRQEEEFLEFKEGIYHQNAEYKQQQKGAMSSNSSFTSPASLALGSMEGSVQNGHRSLIVPDSDSNPGPPSSISLPHRSEQTKSGGNEEFVEQPMDACEVLPEPAPSLESELNHTWSDPIIAKLKPIFHDKAHYRQLLSRRGLQAQRLLNLLQILLNTPDLEEDFRNDVLTAMQRLSEKSELYPECFDLKGTVQLEGDGPIVAGSFADVYEGRFRDQRVCFKMIRVYQTSQVNYVIKHVSREAILWGQLSHKNLLPFYGIYKHSPRKVCLVSPWAHNGDIREYLTRNPDIERVHLSLDVAAGILYLHEQGIIHGDIKGANVLVNDSGIACLADFGLSGVIDLQILNWTSQSSPASTGGSVRWQAPELLAPEDPEKTEKTYNSKPGDVYAWSCVCYEIFTGQDPFFEDTRPTTVTFKKVIRGETPSCPPPTSAAWSSWGLTRSIWELMNRCWAHDPSKRPLIDDVIAVLNQDTREDSRPAQRWGYIPPWRFRSAVSEPNWHPSVEDLEAMLSS